jgi:hypothetical protein
MANKVFAKKNIMCNDGFITRLQNRRIICWKSGDSWYMKFIRFHKEDITSDAKYFDSCIKKMGGYITTKLLKVSEEAFINLIHMGFSYFNPQYNLVWKEPKANKKSTKSKKK